MRAYSSKRDSPPNTADKGKPGVRARKGKEIGGRGQECTFKEPQCQSKRALSNAHTQASGLTINEGGDEERERGKIENG